MCEARVLGYGATRVSKALSTGGKVSGYVHVYLNVLIILVVNDKQC